MLRTIGLTIIAAALSGCVLTDQRQPQITLEQDLAVGFGSGVFDLVELSSLDGAGQAGVDHVRVVMYRVTPVNDQHQFEDSVFQPALAEQGAQLTWKRIVRVRENGQQIWVFAGMDLAALRLESVCVFVLDNAQTDDRAAKEVAALSLPR